MILIEKHSASCARAPRIASFLTILALAVACPSDLRAQSSNAQLSGSITDTSGAVISGARIVAVNVATNVPYIAVSNGAGIYVLTEMLPGTYSVTVTATGFGIEKRSGLLLSTGDRLTQNFGLKPGSVETR